MNAEVTLRSYVPSVDLQPFVKRYLLAEMPWIGKTQIIPAWTKPMLALQYAEPVRSSINGTLEPVANVTINGLVSGRYEFTAGDGDIRLFVVEFTNVGLYSLFREKGSVFTNRSVDAEDLIPTQKRLQICEALYEVKNLDRKVALVEEFLRQFVPDRVSVTAETTQRAIRMMRAAEKYSSIRAITDELDMGDRHFRRMFRDVTGLPPKMFQRIERFNRVFAAVVNGDTNLYRRLMYDGFFDQSHLIHDFEAFTGLSPGAVPRENFLMFNVLTAPEYRTRTK